jgi:TonB family protein
MKTLIIVFLVVMSAMNSNAQTDIKNLEKEAKTTQKKEGKKSLAYANALITLAEGYQDMKDWESAEETLETVRAIKLNPTGDGGIREIDLLDVAYQYAQMRGKVLKGAPILEDQLPNTWFFNCVYYDETSYIEQVLELIYEKESFYSEIGYAYWEMAKKNYVTSSKDHSTQVNQLYTLLADKAKVEFGVKSKERIGVLFGQAKYNERKGAKDLASKLKKEVQAVWGNVFAMTYTKPLEEKKKDVKVNQSPSEINAPTYTIVEEMPRFHGCETLDEPAEEKKRCSDQKLMSYIYKNISYPDNARENGIEGSAIAQFTVSEYGHLYDIKIIRTVSEDIDEEVLRMMNDMNELPFRWASGKLNGDPVRVKMNMPVRFRLN